MKRLYDYAEMTSDILFFMPNDFECRRRIDFGGIIKFFKEHPEAGQVQMVRWKGEKKGERPRNPKNWLTGKMAVVSKRGIGAGGETLREATWAYTELLIFNRLKLGMNLYQGHYKGLKTDETIGGKNFMKTGLKIYEMENQPFWNLDPDGKKQTKGRPV
jgi:hypothetical protein